MILLSSYPNLPAACATAEAVGGPLYVDASVTMTSSLVTNAVLIACGGVITTGAYDLTVRSIDGPEIQLFDKAGSGTILIAQQSESLLGWFGPKGNGVADDTNPVERWLGSSNQRRTDLEGRFSVETIDVPSSNVQKTSTIGGGINVTIFVSRAGDDIFRFPGVEVDGLDYVSFVTFGGMSFEKADEVSGDGYAMHVPDSVSTGYSNLFFDTDTTGMDGGAFKDASDSGLFSSRWVNCRGGECGEHVFDMMGGGPASVMEQCYARNAEPGKAGFRIVYPNLVLRDCNGLNIDSGPMGFWGIFGSSVDPITISATGASVTIPAGDAGDVPANTLLENCNVESFPDVAILAINGSIRSDQSTLFQTRVDATDCIAVYSTNLGTGRQGTLPPVTNFALVGTATWANGCPVWVHDNQPMFTPPLGDYADGELKIYAYTPGLEMTQSAMRTEYIGFTNSGRYDLALRTQALSDGTQRVDFQTPSSSSAAGSEGEVAVDRDYVYVCVLANTWKRAALSTW
jgi:hypothetical protein